MNTIIRLMNSSWGRGTRVVLGFAIICIGVALASVSPAGIVLVVAGLKPIFMGVWGRSLLESFISLHAAR